MLRYDYKVNPFLNLSILHHNKFKEKLNGEIGGAVRDRTAVQKYVR